MIKETLLHLTKPGNTLSGLPLRRKNGIPLSARLFDISFKPSIKKPYYLIVLSITFVVIIQHTAKGTFIYSAFI
jgi:hypothetical protein